jgi:hypothetical protein
MHFHQNLRKDKKPRFPKFIHYAAHAETLSLFYEALGLHRPDRADPAEAFFIEYFKEDDKYYVRMVQKNVDEKLVRIPGEEDKMPIEEFIYYIN